LEATVDGSFYPDLLVLARARILLSLPLPHFVPATAEVGSNNIDVLVLGDFPAEEAREFFMSVVLEPELHSAVTDDLWANIYQVRLLFIFRFPLLFAYMHALTCSRCPCPLKDAHD
jgi:hypothetical protein